MKPRYSSSSQMPAVTLTAAKPRISAALAGRMIRIPGDRSNWARTDASASSDASAARICVA